MMTVEITETDLKDAIEVYLSFDHEGLERFIFELKKLHSSGGHLHFMTPAWAGDELDGRVFGEGGILVNHMRVTVIPDEFLRKQT